MQRQVSVTPTKHGIAAPHRSSPSSFDSVLVGGRGFTLGTVSQCHEPMEDTGVCSATVQDFVPLQQCTADDTSSHSLQLFS